MPVIDTHTHLFPAAWAPHGRMPPDMFDVPALLDRQAEAGVGASIISDPHIWYGDLDPGSIERTREYNDFAAVVQQGHAPRIVALGSVTPWRGKEHIDEAHRAVEELGLKGLAIPTSDQDRYLDEVPEAFWELVTDLDVTVFLHPGGSIVGQTHMGEYRLGEVCGRPLDTTLTLAKLILKGGLERHPRLRLLCPHGGGGICVVADRLDFGHELRDYAPLGPWGEIKLPSPPSTYVARLFVDTVTYGPLPLRLAIDRLGPEHVVFGTDNPPVPFPLQRSIDLVRGLGLPEPDENAILGGNAAALFHL